MAWHALSPSGSLELSLHVKTVVLFAVNGRSEAPLATGRLFVAVTVDVAVARALLVSFASTFAVYVPFVYVCAGVLFPYEVSHVPSLVQSNLYCNVSLSISLPDAVNVNLPSFEEGLAVVVDLRVNRASSVDEATIPAMLLNVHAPVIVWVADLDAGPLVQSNLTYAADAVVDMLNWLASKET